MLAQKGEKGGTVKVLRTQTDKRSKFGRGQLREAH